MKDGQKSRIDRLRDAAISIKVGGDGDDSRIVSSIPLGRRLLFVKGGSIYEIQLADQIDPERKNPGIPNVQRKIISYGSDSEFVCRTLLLVERLFDWNLDDVIDRERALLIVLDITTKLAHMADLLKQYEDLEDETEQLIQKEIEKSQRGEAFMLPEIRNIEGITKSFFIEAKHVTQGLWDLGKEFYGDELKKKHRTGIQELAIKRFGEETPMNVFLEENAKLCELIRATRNTFEHTDDTQHVNLTNVSMDENGQIDFPTFKLVHPKEGTEQFPLRPLLKGLFRDLVDLSETFIVILVQSHLQKWGKFDRRIVHLPESRRRINHVEFGIALFDGDEMIGIF